MKNIYLFRDQLLKKITEQEAMGKTLKDKQSKPLSETALQILSKELKDVRLCSTRHKNQVNLPSYVIEEAEDFSASAFSGVRRLYSNVQPFNRLFNSEEGGL